MKKLYVSLTQSPIYDTNIKANLYAKGVFKSNTNIVTTLQLHDETITSIKKSRLPFSVSSQLSPNTAYIIECGVKNDSKKIYILQTTISGNKFDYVFVYCNSNDKDLFSIMADWIKEESQDISDESINNMTENMKQCGRHNFMGREKECGFLMYYFDLETELNE